MHCTHKMQPIPAGLKVGDLIPAFSSVRFELRIGERSSVCAGCGKPFGPTRKATKEVRIYSPLAEVPVASAYPICGHCMRMHERGGHERDEVLAKIEAFHEGRG